MVEQLTTFTPSDDRAVVAATLDEAIRRVATDRAFGWAEYPPYEPAEVSRLVARNL